MKNYITQVFYIYHKKTGIMHNRAFTKMGTMLSELVDLGPEYDYGWSFLPFVGRSVCYVRFLTQQYANQRYPVTTELPNDLPQYIYACTEHAKDSDEWKTIKSVLLHHNYPFEGKSETNFIEDATSIRNLRPFDARFYNSKFYLHYEARIERIRVIKN